MSFWLDVGSVVVQNVEDKVRLVLVRANDSCIAWHVIGYQGIGAYAFLQPEIFTGMPGVDCVDLCFHALAVATGMLQVVDIVLVEHRQRGGGVGNPVASRMQRLGLGRPRSPQFEMLS
jgi:hypothetical protein